MLTTPTPDAAEASANATFDAILWALSRPGLPRHLPQAGEVGLIAALLDRECHVYAGDPLLIPMVAQSGAKLVDVPQADHVFLGRLTDLDLLRQLRCGSDLYPDEAATLVLRATFGEGPKVRLTGPGVNGAVEVQIAGLPTGFWAARTDMIRYPMGFDMLLLDGTQVIGLPRSTMIEVL
ncbi:MAG: phosphonate C-P lyase system protein PhnH [Yoonia sp.]|uniref:phosphonate C-P lyase system protein PhnH n=1 Tax=Yoonia sp. TaxID=2212373 RepID=UPI003EF71AC1